MSDAYDDYNDLDSFGAGYKPEQPFTLGLDALADGIYEFQILSAELTRTSKKATRIMRCVLLVGGRQLERAWFLESQENMNALGADFCALGIDARSWGSPQHPLSTALPVAVKQLVGIKFRAEKRDRKGKDGNTYVNLIIHGRVGGPPAANGTMPAPAPAAVVPPPFAPVPVAANSNDEIPF